MFWSRECGVRPPNVSSLASSIAPSIHRVIHGATRRVIHLNQPRYAILDECTSGVAAAMERKLYGLLNSLQIS